MKRRAMQIVCSYSLAMLMLTGCIMSPPVLDTLYGPSPGTYYVEQHDTALYYYQLPERGGAGSWMRLVDSADWYVGPGFYDLDQNQNWSWDEDNAGLTLDEFIQLYDPTPAPPAAP